MALNKQIKLIYFCLSPGFGGAEQYLVNILKLLPVEEFEALCIGVDQEVLDQIRRHVNRSDISYSQFKLAKKPSVKNTVLPLTRTISAKKPDVVHINGIDGYGPSSYVILAARIARTPVVLGTFHTTMMKFPKYTFLDELFKRLVDSQLDAGILVSRNSEQLVLESRYLPRKKLNIIPNGVLIPKDDDGTGHPVNFIENNTIDKVITIGTAARLIPGKDIASFLRAAAILNESGLQLRYIVFGDGPERERLSALTEEHKLTDQVTFAGWQANIGPALRELDTFVLTSLEETSPLVILEAMANWVPVIATRVGGVPELVIEGETGLLIPPNDPQSLANSIRTLASSPETRTKMGALGRQRAVEYFSAQRMVAETCSYYEQLLLLRAGAR